MNKHILVVDDEKEIADLPEDPGKILLSRHYAHGQNSRQR